MMFALYAFLAGLLLVGVLSGYSLGGFLPVLLVILSLAFAYEIVRLFNRRHDGRSVALIAGQSRRKRSLRGALSPSVVPPTPPPRADGVNRSSLARTAKGESQVAVPSPSARLSDGSE